MVLPLLTSDEWFALGFLVYLVVPVIAYLLGALALWLWRRSKRRRRAVEEEPATGA